MNFQSEIIDVNEITKEARVTIPSSVLADSIEKEIDKIQKTVKLDGFRPGKAPRNLVKKKYETSVSGQVMSDCINQSVKEVIQTNDLKVIGTPVVDIKSYAEGKDLEFTATISLLPQPIIKDFDGIEIEIPAEAIKESDVEQTIKSYLKSHGTMEDVSDRADINEDDIITGTISVFIGDMNAGNYDDYVIDLGENTPLPDMKEKMIGTKLGDKVEIIIDKTPDGEELKPEQIAKYVIEPKKISARVLPELNDEFVQKLKIEEAQNVEQFKKHINAALERELEAKQKNIIAEKVLGVVSERNAFLIPELMVDFQIRDMLISRKMVAREQVNNPNFDVSIFREQFAKEAEELLKNAIILDSIAEQENIIVSEDDFQEEIHKDMKLYNIDHDALHKYFDNPEVRQRKELQISRDKVLDFLKSKTKITIKEN